MSENINSRIGCWFCFKVLDPAEAEYNSFVKVFLNGAGNHRTVLLHESCLKEVAGLTDGVVEKVTLQPPPPLDISPRNQAVLDAPSSYSISTALVKAREKQRNDERLARSMQVIRTFILGMIIILCLLGAGYLGIAELHYQSAQKLIKQNRWDGASSEVSFVMKWFPGYRNASTLRLEVYYLHGRTALNGAQWEEARKAFETLIALNPNYQDVQNQYKDTFYLPAKAALGQKKWDEARSILNALLTREPNDATAATLIRESYYQPAVTALDEGEWSAAQSAIANLAHIAPDYKDVQSLRREVYYRPAVQAIQRKDWKSAIQSISQLWAIDNQYKDTRSLISEAYYQEGVEALDNQDWQEAETVLTTLKGIDSQYKDTAKLLEDAHFQVGLAAFKAKDWEAAQTALEQIGQGLSYKDAQNMLLESYYELAVAAHNNKDLAKAQSYLEKVTRIDMTYKETATLSRQIAKEYSYAGWDSTLTPSILNHNTDVIRDLVFSTDGTMLASASYDKTITIWSIPDKSVIQILKGHTATVMNVAFSPDNRTVASASLDGTIRLWSVSSGADLHTYTLGKREMLDVSFSPDGNRLAASSMGPSFWVWPSQSDASNSRQFVSHAADVYQVIFSPDGKYLITGSEDHSVIVWDATTFNRVYTISTTGTVKRIAVSPDSKLLAYTNSNSAVVHDLTTGRVLFTVPKIADNILEIAFYPSSQIIASLEEANIAFWSLETQEKLVSYKYGGMQCFAFSPDGRWMAVGLSTGQVLLYARQNILP